MSNEYETIKTLNGVAVVRRNSDGKFGIHDLETGDISYRYKSEHQASVIAQGIADENSRISAYIASTK